MSKNFAVLVVLITFVLSAGCESETTESGAQNESGPAWTVVINGGEGVVDLPDIEGTDFSGVVAPMGTQMIGMDADAGNELRIRLAAGEALEARDYTPGMFQVRWDGLSYSCLGAAGMTVTVTDVEPLRGTFAGPVVCYQADSVNQGKFKAQASGVFNATMGTLS